MNLKEKIGILKIKLQEAVKAKSEKRLWKALRRRLVPKTWKRITNELHYHSFAKENKGSVASVISHQEQSYFGVNLPLIKLDGNGAFVFPQRTTRVMIDVGTSTNWPNSIDWLNRHPENSVVIG